MASFTPVDVVRLAPVFRHRVPDEDLHLGSILSPSTSFPRNRYCERASPMSSHPRLLHRVHHQGEDAPHQ